MPLPTSPSLGGNNLPKKPAHLDPKNNKPSLSEAPKPVTHQKPGKTLDDTVGLGSYASNRRRGFTGDATMLSSITVEEALNSPYEKSFKYLEPKVVEVKDWLQNHITESNLSKQVGEARKNRGEELTTMKHKLDQVLLKYFSNNPFGSQQDTSKVASLVLNEILGFGPLEPLWGDKSITEIMVNGPKKVYIEKNGKLTRAHGIQFRDSDHLLELCQQVLGQIGKTLDIAHSYEDGRLSDGSRINATHPVISPIGPSLTIRRFPEKVFTLRALIETGSFTPEMAVEVGNLILHKSSVIVSGGTGSGKTSMLNALSGCIPNNERIITIEDSLELRLHPDRHVLGMESRKTQQGDEKTLGNVSIRDLVKNALRQRPDRIIVGEVRDSTAYDMLQAFNTGHEGSMSTIHANNPRAAIERLGNLVSQAGELNADQAITLISSSVDILVQLSRFEDGSRRVSEIVEIPSRVEVTDSGKVRLEPRVLWEFQQTGVDEDNKIIGEYVKINDISDDFVKVHRLDKRRRYTLEELLEISDLPDTDEEEVN